MFLTSLTSTVAFLASSMTPIRPIQANGIFAALIVPLDFVLTVTMQPATYYVYETYVLTYWDKFVGN